MVCCIAEKLLNTRLQHNYQNYKGTVYMIEKTYIYLDLRVHHYDVL